MPHDLKVMAVDLRVAADQGMNERRRARMESVCSAPKLDMA
jgi:hypothetical protein